ncbi:multidrug transporter [Spirosoma sp. BT702]|uniref:Multidrug transporter n=1 Tax=Spirosoma profusum TaxID=2771354 RepID=A0A926XST0_9BACT|nr:bestrophin family ion channel [Spirosoma profusum]MBD2699364.1 multidrug transporter [Spirosoma profusum]
MHAGRKYSLSEFIVWTRRDIYWLIGLAAIPTVLYQVLGWKWLAIPWVPIAMIGTAAAFIVGFKNNATYGRLWEARQIYGGIVNLSRTWGIMVKDFVRNTNGSTSPQDLQSIHQQLILRHIAWLTALRFQLREERTWENTHQIYNEEYQRFYKIPEKESSLAEELKPLLWVQESEYVLSKKNRAVHLISLQSKQLGELVDEGLLTDLRHVEMAQMLKDLYDQQGKCERIKNFPYPRQFASINLFFIRLFVMLVPFGLLQEFAKLGGHFVWLTIPFSVLVSWVFNSMERVGESTENPFEGGPNDVPITSMSRGIEIDLREMLDQPEIPSALQPVNNILM